MASCPRCSTTGLKHTLISEDLPAHACPDCDGLLISLIAYRRWRETHHPAKGASEQIPRDVADQDSKDVVGCTKCGGIMTKFRIMADSPNHIDFCAHCEDIWLDHGEWELIDAMAGADHLNTILTQPWQRRVRSESQENMERQRLRSMLGPDFDKVAELKDWLETHQHRDVIFAYLRRKLH